MILAERLCLFGFDPQSGRERATPAPGDLSAAFAALVLADLIHAGRVVATDAGLRQHDRLPLSHPLLREAAEKIPAAVTNALPTVLHDLRAAAPRWWRRLHETLAERDLLELQIPFPFLRRYRLRSRQAWNESVAMLCQPAVSNRVDIALTLATHRCGWLADVVDAENARRCLVAAQAAADEGGAAAWITRAFAAA